MTILRETRDELRSRVTRLATMMDQHAELMAGLQRQVDRLHDRAGPGAPRWRPAPGSPAPAPDADSPEPPDDCGHQELLAALESQIANLERALVNRDTVGMAKGVLMARGGCTADEAFDMLRRASQRTNRKLTTIAAEILAANERRRASPEADTDAPTSPLG